MARSNVVVEPERVARYLKIESALGARRIDGDFSSRDVLEFTAYLLGAR